MGAVAALGGSARLAWVADHDPHVSSLLRARFPDVPNLGDLAAVRWNRVEPVDVITAGFLCQDISAAARDHVQRGATALSPDRAGTQCAGDGSGL
ncbi:hypothetical protein [Nocardiopsis sp. NPDC006832]|uniref:hypothetical protein n=1 Tax=Nocardiopsis sp. NPDC006832 TaxID=3157188 RepID=UPI0033E1817F